MTANKQLREHLIPTIGSRIRYIRNKLKLGNCGKNVYFEYNVSIFRYPSNVYISDGVVLKEGARICSCNKTSVIKIGSNTTIGYHTFIFSSENITIGNNCLIAPFVYIVDSDHGILKSENINQQPNLTSPIVIGDDVWIGSGSKILKGVTINNGAVVAAGSVVNQDVPEYSIFGGIPAKEIGKRE